MQRCVALANFAPLTLGRGEFPDMGQFFPYSSQLNGMPIIGHYRKTSLNFLFSLWELQIIIEC
jgi:hypothetical protein